MSSETPTKLAYSFEGKKVLITGGGRGVGQALVSRLYNDGASVFVLERDPNLVSQLLADFPDKHRLRAEVCDISKWKETQSFISDFGPLDHLVNCAAIATTIGLDDMKEEDVDNIFGVNLKSHLCTSQAVAKGMIEAGIRGTIVSIASVAGHVAIPQNPIYCITKAGVIMLTKCLAVCYGKQGIRSNSVSPTAIDTPMMREAMEGMKAAGRGDIALLERQVLSGKKILDRDDMVNAILFLLSPLSSLANGSDLVLDGGILSG